jgi:hypothetical protein
MVLNDTHLRRIDIDDVARERRLRRRRMKDVFDIAEQLVDVLAGNPQASFLMLIKFSGASRHCRIPTLFGHDSSK